MIYIKRIINIITCCFFVICVSAQTMVVTKKDGTSIEFLTKDLKEVSFHAASQYVNLPTGTVDFGFPSGTLWANTVVSFNPAIHNAGYDFGDWELPTKEQIEELLAFKIEQGGIINGYVKEHSGTLKGILTSSASITIPLCFSGIGVYGGDDTKYDGFYVAFKDKGKLMFHQHKYFYDSIYDEYNQGFVRESCDAIEIPEGNDAYVLLVSKQKRKRRILDGHAAVDFALPSGTIWAAEPMAKSYLWGTTSADAMNSPTYSREEFIQKGIINDDNTLTELFDPVKVNWGGKWRLPTVEEFQELVSYTQTYVLDDMESDLIALTDNKGNVIVLPAGHYMTNKTIFEDFPFSVSFGTSCYTFSYGMWSNIGDSCSLIEFKSRSDYVLSNWNEEGLAYRILAVYDSSK